MEDEKVLVSTRISEDLFRQFEESCRKADRTVASMLRFLIRQAVGVSDVES